MSGLGFLAPLALWGLLSMPVLWWLLKRIPPAPRRIRLPTLPLVADLAPAQPSANSLPWWWLLVRLALVSALVLAAAAPWVEPVPIADRAVSGPHRQVILIDDSFVSAPVWAQMQQAVRAFLAAEGAAIPQAGGSDGSQPTSAQAPVALLVASEAGRGLPVFERKETALARVQALTPKAFAVALPEALRLAVQAKANVAVFTGGVVVDDAPAGGHIHAWQDALAQFTQAGLSLRFFVPERGEFAALSALQAQETGFAVDLVRPFAHSALAAVVQAKDAQGRVLGSVAARFAPGEKRHQILLPLAQALLRASDRVEIAGQNHAGAVQLVDGSTQRRKVAVVSGQTGEGVQKLLSGAYYVEKALEPYADLLAVSHSKAAQDPVRAALDHGAEVVILVDYPVLSPVQSQALAAFLHAGGTLVRFASLGMGESEDLLLAVPLRENVRRLQGALSWEQPQALAPFAPSSPFGALARDLAVRVQAQMLPRAELAQEAQIWAALEDGTPLISVREGAALRAQPGSAQPANLGTSLGNGRLVLFHIGAGPDWSNLPISGLFVEIMRKLVEQAPRMLDFERKSGQNPQVEAGAELSRAPVSGAALLAPDRLLDGFGQLAGQVVGIEGVKRGFAQPASQKHPAGFYGAGPVALAVQVLRAGMDAIPPDLVPVEQAGAVTYPMLGTVRIDLRGYLLALALGLLALDGALTLGRAGLHAGRRRLPSRAQAGAGPLLGGMLVLFLLALFMVAGVPDRAFAQGNAMPPRPNALSPALPSSLSPSSLAPDVQAMRAALKPRLGFMRPVDGARARKVEAGLTALSRFAAERTSLALGEPVGLDPARDPLVFYPLIYWAIEPDQPPLSAQAAGMLNAYLRQGGMLVIDSAQGGRLRGDSQAMRTLHRALQGVELPALALVPRDHVLYRSFYLLEALSGRMVGESMAEPLSQAESGTVGPTNAAPVRGGDRVSAVIVTNTDLVAAFALDAQGGPLYPMEDPRPRAREMAIRSGINLLLYAFTGNYKADQIHIPALLKRLGP